MSERIDGNGWHSVPGCAYLARWVTSEPDSRGITEQREQRIDARALLSLLLKAYEIEDALLEEDRKLRETLLILSRMGAK